MTYNAYNVFGGTLNPTQPSVCVCRTWMSLMCHCVSWRN